ncbi:MAG: hypothetical protein ACRCYO_09090 [Bacteroidia bacterium]
MNTTSLSEKYPSDPKAWEDACVSIIYFLQEIGLEVKELELPAETFVPGIQIQHGTICFDRSRLLFPGDLLHEAGHLAVKKSSERHLFHVDSAPDMGDEIGTMCWSFAAAKKIGLPIDYVFHPFGYKGASGMFIENFSAGIFIGLPLIEWMGLAYSPEKAQQQQKEAFPVMQRWLRA